MKKISFLLITLCLCMFLSACDASDPDNLFGTEQETAAGTTDSTSFETDPIASETETSESGAEATDPAGGDEGTITMEPGYQYGNRQRNMPPGNYMRYQDTVLFFPNRYNGPDQLYEYDMNTGEVSLFCKDATCSHDADKCVSGGVNGQLEQYDGRLFASSFSGRNNEILLELKDGRFQEILRGVSLFWHGNGNLYVHTDDSSLLLYENGSTTPRTLLEEYVGLWSMVFGDYLYGCTVDSVVRVDLRATTPQVETVLELNDLAGAFIDGRHIYYRNADDHCYLYRCDMDGRNSERFLEKPIANLNFDDEYLYLVLETEDGNFYTEVSRDVYRVSKADPTQVEIIASLPEIAFQVFTVPGYDKVFVTTRLASEGEDGDPPIYEVSIDGSGARKLELPED